MHVFFFTFLILAYLCLMRMYSPHVQKSNECMRLRLTSRLSSRWRIVFNLFSSVPIAILSQLFISFSDYMYYQNTDVILDHTW